MKANARIAVSIVLASIGSPTFALQAAPAPARPAPAAISTQADALGQCLIDKSTGEDRVTLARWALAAMASTPKVADLAKVDPARKVALDKSVAALFTRLIVRDCPAQARPLFRAKNKAAFGTAFGQLGKIAFQELLGDPRADATMGEFTQYLNEKDFADVVK